MGLGGRRHTREEGQVKGHREKLWPVRNFSLRKGMGQMEVIVGKGSEFMARYRGIGIF